jgi:predicted nucleic acid-binding protein
VSGVVADTSVWIEFFAGRPVPGLEDALAHEIVVVPPVVVAELVSGARRNAERASITALVDELPIHDTPVDHWIRVGELRRTLMDRGLSVSTPDAQSRSARSPAMRFSLPVTASSRALAKPSA